MALRLLDPSTDELQSSYADIQTQNKPIDIPINIPTTPKDIQTFDIKPQDNGLRLLDGVKSKVTDIALDIAKPEEWNKRKNEIIKEAKQIPVGVKGLASSIASTFKFPKRNYFGDIEPPTKEEQDNLAQGVQLIGNLTNEFLWRPMTGWYQSLLKETVHREANIDDYAKGKKGFQSLPRAMVRGLLGIEDVKGKDILNAAGIPKTEDIVLKHPILAMGKEIWGASLDVTPLPILKPIESISSILKEGKYSAAEDLAIQASEQLAKAKYEKMGNPLEATWENLPQETKNVAIKIVGETPIKELNGKSIADIFYEHPYKSMVEKFKQGIGSKGSTLNFPEIPENLIKELSLTPEQITNIGKGIFTGIPKIALDKLKEAGISTSPQAEIVQPGADLKGETIPQAEGGIVKSSQVKSIIRKETGQVKEPELRLLKTQIKFEAGAAQEGYRAGLQKNLKQYEQELATLQSKENFKSADEKLASDIFYGKKVAELKRKISETKIQLSTNYKIKRTELLSKIKTRQEDISSIRKDIIDYTKENLPVYIQGKLLSMINSATTQEGLARAFSRIDNYAEINRKQILIKDIKKQVSNLLESNSIAIEYKNKIRGIIEDVDFTKHREATFQKLRNIEQYIKTQKEKGNDVTLPEEIISSLKMLSKNPLIELTEKEILVLKDKLDLLEQLGKTKLRARQEIYKYEKEKIVSELSVATDNLDKYAEIRPDIGGKLSFPDILRNKISSLLSLAQQLDLAISPMDVVFDILDGGKGTYSGANYTNFKAKTDVNFSKYLDRKYSITKPIDDLTNELKLTESNFDRIGTYAVLQQEGGLQKLLNSGYTEKEIMAVKLTDNEMKWYVAARKALDILRPDIAEIMRTVYNQELGKVENYFSFMTDWKVMDEAEVFQRVGLNTEEYGAPTKNIEMGFTKTRTGPGIQKIKINAGEIFSRHIDNAAYLIEMAKDNKMLFEIANSDAYKKIAGAKGQKIVLEWLDTISRKGGMQGQQQIQILDILRRNVGLGVLGLKLTSAFIQPTSLIDAASYIGNWAFKGAQNIATSKDWFNLVIKFPEIRTRIGDDPAYKDMEVFGKIGEIGMYALQQLDKLAAMATCAGAYEKKMVELGLPIDFNNINLEAMQYAQFVLRRTQSSGIFKDVPSAVGRGGLTGNRSIDKFLLQFQSFMLNKWSIIRHDIWRAGIKEKNPKKAIGMFFWLMMATLAGAGIRTGINTAKNSIMHRQSNKGMFWKNFAQDAYQNIPFMGQISGGALYGSIPVPALATIQQFFEDFNILSKSKKPETKQRAFLRLLATSAQVAGIPGSAEARSWIKGPQKTKSHSSLRLLR